MKTKKSYALMTKATVKAVKGKAKKTVKKKTVKKEAKTDLVTLITKNLSELSDKEFSLLSKEAVKVLSKDFGNRDILVEMLQDLHAGNFDEDFECLGYEELFEAYVTTTTNKSFINFLIDTSEYIPEID